MTYRDELILAMTLLGKHSDTVFIGQAVKYKGTAMTGTLVNVPDNKKIETPVFEETQLGLSVGLALQGFIPVTIFPRWNFLLLATNQLVNHLDKIPLYSSYKPKVIIRTGIGSESPLWPGEQHVGDFTEAFGLMCKTLHIERLDTAERIVPAYMDALARDGSTLLVEVSGLI